MEMWEVQETIEGAHSIHLTYLLLPGDLLRKDEDGTFTKEAPGLCVRGFVLTTAQQERLVKRTVIQHGLKYAVVREGPSDPPP
jgi:hypothetical protein